MTRQNQHILIFFLLSLASYGVWKYYFDREKNIIDKPFTKGYSVENIELRITDESGKLTGKFQSPNLIRYTDSPVVHISTPLFWMYEKGQEQWLIKSKKAEYNASFGEVGLYENLIAQTINTENPMSFEANNLFVNLQTKKAHTDDGISIKQQQFTMTGQNARFDLKNEILEVNNNVKAVYKSQYNVNNEKTK